MTLTLKDFSNSITNEQVGLMVYQKIKEILATDATVDLDFTGVIVMTTFCAKQIFGRLYSEIGASEFGRRIFFHNVSDDLKVVVNHGLSRGAS